MNTDTRGLVRAENWAICVTCVHLRFQLVFVRLLRALRGSVVSSTADMPTRALSGMDHPHTRATLSTAAAIGDRLLLGHCFCEAVARGGRSFGSWRLP